MTSEPASCAMKKAIGERLVSNSQQHSYAQLLLRSLILTLDLAQAVRFVRISILESLCSFAICCHDTWIPWKCSNERCRNMMLNNHVPDTYPLHPVTTNSMIRTAVFLTSRLTAKSSSSNISQPGFMTAHPQDSYALFEITHRLKTRFLMGRYG